MNDQNTSKNVYLNGKILPETEAQISVMDRGFLLGDSVYEVIPIYNGKAFRQSEHLKRLDNSLKAIQINNPLSTQEWEKAIDDITSQYSQGRQSLYLQVTRGVAKVRDHVFPDPNIQPTVFIMSTPVKESTYSQLALGISAITMDDIRWQYCCIKATTLLANVLARQRAAEQNAAEAILIRNGYALEGAASNLFIIKNHEIITPPKGDELLPGITRDLILELAEANQLPYHEQPIPLEQLQNADEIWLSSSVRELVPVIQLDQKAVTQGHPGPLWKKMYQLFSAYKQTF